MPDTLKTLNGTPLASLKTIGGVAVASAGGWGDVDILVYSAEATALFAAMTSQPSDARKALINTCIVALKAAGVWTAYDLLYVLAAHDSQAARLNWKNPGANTLTTVNSPTFTTDRGYTGNGSNTRLLPGVAPSGLTQFVQNSAHFSTWVLTAGGADANRAEIGTTVGSGFGFICKTGTNITRARINSTTNVEPANTQSAGFYHINRSSSSNVQAYKAGSQVLSQTSNTSSTRDTSVIEFLSWQGLSGFSNKQVASFSVGGSLDATQALAKYNALLTYMQGVGAA